MSVDDFSFIRDHIAQLVRSRLSTPIADEALLSVNFSELGFDSEMLVVMSGELSQTFAIDIDPVDVFEFSTIELLAAHVAGQRQTTKP